jgi:hypothetical protein
LQKQCWSQCFILKMANKDMAGVTTFLVVKHRESFTLGAAHSSLLYHCMLKHLSHTILPYMTSCLTCRLLLLVSCLAYSSTLKMVEIRSSETSGFLRTRRCYNSEDRDLHNQLCENLKSNLPCMFRVWIQDRHIDTRARTMKRDTQKN